MNLTLRYPAKVALGLIALLLLLLGVAWLALPGLIQSQAQKIVLEKSGHSLSLARPEIDLFSLSVRLRELRLNDPEGEALLGFNELLIDLSASSLMRRTWVFDAIDVEGLEARLVVRGDNQATNNWSRLLAAFANSPESETETSLPRVDVARLHVGASQLDFADQRANSAFSTRIAPVALDLTDISTLPDDSGHFTFSARTSFGATIDWQGEASINPPQSTGQIRVAGVDIARLASLLKAQLPPDLKQLSTEGVASLSTDYRLAQTNGKLELLMNKLKLGLKNLRLSKADAAGAPMLAVDEIALDQGHFDLAKQRLDLGQLSVSKAHLDAATDGESRKTLLRLPKIALASATIDLGGQAAKLATIEVNTGKLDVRRTAQGNIDLVDVIKGLLPTAKPEAAPSNWRYEIAGVALDGLSVALRDDTVTPAGELALNDIGISVANISQDLEAALPIKGSLNVVSGGKLTVEGRLIPASAALDLKLKLDELMLKPAQPYLAQRAHLDIASGHISAEGRIEYNKQHKADTRLYRGSFHLRELRLDRAGTKTAFLAWKSLASRQLELTPTLLTVPELTLSGLDTELIIAENKSTNFTSILRKTEETNQTPATAETAASAFEVNVDRLRFYRGSLKFADKSLLLPFATHIHGLRGSIGGLTSRPDTPGQLELDGEIDDYGLARAVGQVDLFNPTQFLDLKVIFRNIEMTRLTPYIATFAGRTIKSGKLSLNLSYTVKKRQLQSQNQVLIDRLVLGERVESPNAKDLPLDLAIALLQDSKGRIELGLPVTGSLDDPQFSLGDLIWKTIGSVLGKIVTAPFRALGALFGSGEDMTTIAYEAGAKKLTPPEREKLESFVDVLKQRPGLLLSLHGTWNEADRQALQDLKLRRAVLQKSGFRGDTKGDPGPVSTHQTQIQAALESLFSERAGSAELAALKAAFRSANPGQLEESAGGKMMSRLSGLFSPPRELDAKEVEALKGANFHDVLYRKLRAEETISNEVLLELARLRGEDALATLMAAKLPSERVRVLEPLGIDGELHDVPLQLELGKLETRRENAPVKE